MMTLERVRLQTCRSHLANAAEVSEAAENISCVPCLWLLVRCWLKSMKPHQALPEQPANNIFSRTHATRFVLLPNFPHDVSFPACSGCETFRSESVVAVSPRSMNSPTLYSLVGPFKTVGDLNVNKTLSRHSGWFDHDFSRSFIPNPLMTDSRFEPAIGATAVFLKGAFLPP